ncbi:MAG: alpha/beta fold hydrolase [Acidobacteria bacterium]|nr:alpha/beta fold hydrolase [Acidobacteriota bacterium]
MKTKITILTLIVLTALGVPTGHRAQGTVQVAYERHVLPSYVEPNTPGAPGVAVDPALAAAITDPAAFDADGSLNLNKAIYVRFLDRNRTAPPEAILIHIPGPVAGSNSFGFVASEILRLSGGRFEVWAVDRRSNLMEDLMPMIAAENANTLTASQATINAYLNNPAGAGGYLSSHPFAASSFMAEWGVDVMMRDVKTVVDQARTITPSVFLCGHSLGAVLAEIFAGYNFGGGVAGFQLIKGLIILDGTAAPGAPGVAPISDDVYFNGGAGPAGDVVGLNQLRSPTAPEHAPFLVEPFNPLLFQLVEIGCQLALLDPDGPSVLRQVVPTFVPVPATNAAAIGMNIDDEFQSEIFARFSIGFLRVPSGGSATDVATRTDDPSSANPNGLWRPKDLGSTLQQWDARKDLSSIGLAGPEVSDFNTVVRSFLLGAGNQTTAIGDTNSLEWYFPNRLVTDVSKLIDLGKTPLSAQAIAAMTARGDNPLMLTENKKVNVPLLAIRTTEGGFVPSNLAFLLYRQSTSIPQNKVSVFTMNNYAHVDVLYSVEKRSSPGSMNVPELISNYIQSNQ